MNTIPETAPDVATSPLVVWAGLDVAKATFDAALCLGGPGAYALRDLPVRTFPRTAQGACECIQWFDAIREHTGPMTAIRVVMEATGKYSQELAIWLIAQRSTLAPAIINPQQAAAFIQSLFLRNITDKTAARALACYGMERHPAPYEPPSHEQAVLRDLSRHRDALVAMRVAHENRMEEGSQSTHVRRAQQRLLATIERHIKNAEQELRTQVAAMPDVRSDVALLQTIYGVGFLTAATILAELGDLRRFERGRQLSAFAGLSPRNIRSGTSVSKRPRLSKKGNPRVRQALYLAAMVACRGNNHLSDTYYHLIAQGKAPKAALGAIMRKLLLVMRAVLLSGKPYDPHHAPGGKLSPRTAVST